MSKSGAFTLLGTPIGAALGTMTNNAPGRKAQGFNHGASVGLLGGIGTDALAALGTYLGAKADAPGTGAALGAILGAGISYPWHISSSRLKSRRQSKERIRTRSISYSNYRLRVLIRPLQSDCNIL